MGMIYLIALFLIVIAKAYSFETIKISVDKLQREFLLYVPAPSTQEKMPVVFAFHGHGQVLSEAMDKFKLEKNWQEAIIVYPQGLKTAIQPMDPNGKYTGWQTSIGDKKDRDIRFFDEMMSYLGSAYSIDEKRIYVTGFSNGAAFAYVLAAARGDGIAAIAPIAGRLGSYEDLKALKAIPVFHVAGKQDEIVKFKSQKEMIEYLIKLNKCADEGNTVNKNITVYESAINMTVQTFIYNGGHKIPEDAIPFMVEFFKNNHL